MLYKQVMPDIYTYDGYLLNWQPNTNVTQARHDAPVSSITDIFKVFKNTPTDVIVTYNQLSNAFVFSDIRGFEVSYSADYLLQQVSASEIMLSYLNDIAVKLIQQDQKEVILKDVFWGDFAPHFHFYFNYIQKNFSGIKAIVGTMVNSPGHHIGTDVCDLPIRMLSSMCLIPVPQNSVIGKSLKCLSTIFDNKTVPYNFKFCNTLEPNSLYVLFKQFEQTLATKITQADTNLKLGWNNFSLDSYFDTTVIFKYIKSYVKNIKVSLQTPTVGITTSTNTVELVHAMQIWDKDRNCFSDTIHYISDISDSMIIDENNFFFGENEGLVVDVHAIASNTHINHRLMDNVTAAMAAVSAGADLKNSKNYYTLKNPLSVDTELDRDALNVRTIIAIRTLPSWSDAVFLLEESNINTVGKVNLTYTVKDREDIKSLISRLHEDFNINVKIVPTTYNDVQNEFEEHYVSNNSILYNKLYLMKFGEYFVPFVPCSTQIPFITDVSTQLLNLNFDKCTTDMHIASLIKYYKKYGAIKPFLLKLNENGDVINLWPDHLDKATGAKKARTILENYAMNQPDVTNMNGVLTQLLGLWKGYNKNTDLPNPFLLPKDANYFTMLIEL